MPTYHGGRIKSLINITLANRQSNKDKLTTTDLSIPGFKSFLIPTARAKFKDVQFSHCILREATRSPKAQRKLLSHRLHCMSWCSEMIMQSSLPSIDQDDKNLVIECCTLHLCQGSTMLYRFVKPGTIKRCLEAVTLTSSN